jgi:hypothetical protein
MSDTEGEDFISQMRQRCFGSVEHANRRMHAERRAGMTEAERGRRKGDPKGQLNVRTSIETRALFEALCEHLGKSKTDVMQMAIERLAKATPGFKGGRE